MRCLLTMLLKPSLLGALRATYAINFADSESVVILYAIITFIVGLFFAIAGIRLLRILKKLKAQSTAITMDEESKGQSDKKKSRKQRKVTVLQRVNNIWMIDWK